MSRTTSPPPQPLPAAAVPVTEASILCPPPPPPPDSSSSASSGTAELPAQPPPPARRSLRVRAKSTVAAHDADSSSSGVTSPSPKRPRLRRQAVARQSSVQPAIPTQASVVVEPPSDAAASSSTTNSSVLITPTTSSSDNVLVASSPQASTNSVITIDEDTNAIAPHPSVSAAERAAQLAADEEFARQLQQSEAQAVRNQFTIMREDSMLARRISQEGSPGPPGVRDQGNPIGIQIPQGMFFNHNVYPADVPLFGAAPLVR